MSSKGRSAFSNSNPNQAFSVNPQIFSNNPSEAFNFSAGANISPAQPSSSSFHSTQTSPTHPFSPHNHEPTSGALGNVLPKQDNPFGGRHNQYDSQGPYPHHGVVRRGADGGLAEHFPSNRDKQTTGVVVDNGRGMDLDAEPVVALRHRSSSPPSHSPEQLQFVREAFNSAPLGTIAV